MKNQQPYTQTKIDENDKLLQKHSIPISSIF